MNHTTTINLVKALALIGLVALGACKSKEPAANGNGSSNDPQNPGQTVGFMQHIANLDGAKFYRPLVYNGYFTIGTNAKGDVNKITNDYPKDSEESFLPVEHARRDAGAQSGIAFFDVGEKEFKYVTKEKAGPINYDNIPIWTLRRVPESLKKTIDNDRAQFVNIAADQGCDNQVCKSVRYGYGDWYTEPHWLFEDDNFDGVCVKIESKGAKTGLKHSDYGTYSEDYILPADKLAKVPGYAENIEGNICHFVEVYAGGNEISKSFKTTNMVFQGGAVAQVQETDTYARRIVYADKATLTVDAAGNETIDMPFNNWYHVVIVRSANNMTTSFKEGVNIPEYWQMIYEKTKSFPVSYANQKSGLYVAYRNDKYETPFTGKEGVSFGDNDKAYNNLGVRATCAVNYYGDDPYSPTEAVSQGYRVDRDEISENQPNGIFFGFAFGGVRQK